MMGDRLVRQETLFHQFRLDDHIPADHMLRGIDSLLRPRWVEAASGTVLQHDSRPSVDPELMIRMLLVGYCFGIRSERRLCEECISIWPIGGSAGSAWMVRCRSTPPSRRTAMAAF